MKGLLAACVRNPVAANLLVVVVLAAGLASLPRLRQETFPHVDLDVIAVAVAWPGATPDEVESAVCVRVEEAIAGVKGIHRLRSRAREGAGIVWAELEVGADARRVLDDIRSQVDALEGLPEDAERPEVKELVDDSVLLGVAVSGDVDPLTLRAVGERVRDGIAALPEVSRVELVGVADYEIAIEVSEAELQRYDLGFDDVVRAVRASSLDLAAGALKSRGGEIVVRTRARAERGPQFADLVLLTAPDGTRVRLGDVARVRDGFAESDEHLRFDGHPAVVARLLSSERADPVAISRAVRAWVDEAGAWLPAGVSLAVWGDWSRPFESRRGLMLRSGAQGLVLILAVLALFLPLRLALWVTAGIPLAFLGAIATLPAADVSINMMSLFGFIVALGLVVDDAIVIGESVDREQARTGDAVRGAVDGTLEVALPVGIAVATTVLFLAPALALPTKAGKVAYSLAVVVIACLLFSLLEALFVLPAHLSGHRGGRDWTPAWLRRAQQATLRGLEAGVARLYRPALDAALRHPGLALALAAALLLLCGGLVRGDWVRWSFFPDAEDDYVSARVVLPAGTAPEVVQAAVDQLESAARRVAARAREESGAPVLAHVVAAVGDAPDHHDDYAAGGDGPDVGNVRLELQPAELRRASSVDLAERWRREAGPVPGALYLGFWGTDFGPGGPDLDVALVGPPGAVDAAADELIAELGALPGVRDVSDSRSGGKSELRLHVRPEAEAHGLSLAGLARQVRQGFQGEEVQRIVRGRDEVAVVVRYPREERRSPADLEHLWVRTPEGGEVPFAAVAWAERGRGHAEIERRDRQRVVGVTADVDARRVEPRAVRSELVGRVLPRIRAAHPGVDYRLDGASRDETELLGALVRDWLVALLAAYALLAIPLRSYLQPLLILLAVPFGLVGAVLGHLALGIQLCVFSLVGLVALTGVVVNDALVLIDRANRQRGLGLDLRDALREAGTTRFRPILLTSLTTFFGLVPLLFERSAQADWLKPMAVTLGFGVVVGTGITLVVVPAAWALAEDARSAWRRRRARSGVAAPASATGCDPVLRPGA